MTERRALVRPGVWIGVASVAAVALLFAPSTERLGAGDVVQALPRSLAPATVTAQARKSAPARGAGDEVLRVVARVAPAEPEDGRLWLLQPAVDPAPSASPPRAAAGAENTAPSSASAPSAPPPPFRVIGRYADGQREGVVLQGADGAVSIAHAGETLGDSYRVESLAGNVMVLSYLPLNLKLTMDIGIAR